MATDYRSYTKMLGDIPRTVVKGTAHALIVKTEAHVWPVSGDRLPITMVMAFDSGGRYVTQWTETE